MENTLNQVRVQNDESEAFQTISGVKQGDGLSPIVFNLALHYGLKEIQERETLGTANFQILAYADDIAILGENTAEIERCLLELETGTAQSSRPGDKQRKNTIYDSDNRENPKTQ